VGSRREPLIAGKQMFSGPFSEWKTLHRRAATQLHCHVTILPCFHRVGFYINAQVSYLRVAQAAVVSI
jgi:hypothetical protein